MMKTRATLVGALCFLALVPWARGQFTQVVEARVIASQTLSGRVHAKSDEDGLAGVRVQLCDSRWENTFASTMTDSAGHFHFEAMPKGIYHLRLSLPGMDNLLVTVRLKSRAPKTLSLGMWVAT